MERCIYDEPCEKPRVVEIKFHPTGTLTFLTSHSRLVSRITYVQSGPGVTTATHQQATPTPGPAYIPSSLTTLGFTAIAPAGQTLVQPLLAPAPPMSCQSQTPPRQASGAAGRQVKLSRLLLRFPSSEHAQHLTRGGFLLCGTSVKKSSSVSLPLSPQSLFFHLFSFLFKRG